MSCASRADEMLAAMRPPGERATAKDYREYVSQYLAALDIEDLRTVCGAYRCNVSEVAHAVAKDKMKWRVGKG